MNEIVEDYDKRDLTPRRLTLGKGEKLRHKKLVGNLFAEGKSLYDFPIRMVWTSLSPEELEGAFRAGVPPLTDPLQMLITIPKKKRRRAVDRVLLRRRIREAYRLNRLPLIDVINERVDIATVSVAFIWLGEENLPFAEIEKKITALISRLIRKLSLNSSSEI